MKKIAGFIMAVLMLCALCVPAFAEDAKEVEPTKNSDGNDEINLTSSGNYIIKKDCEVYKLNVYGTLTIAENVKVKVTNYISTYKCVLNIESGAVLECSGDSVDNIGTMNVYGTVNADSTQFTNGGTLNVYGTVDISKCRNRINTLGGTINVQGTLTCGGSSSLANSGGIINKYCTGTFKGNYKNIFNGIMNTGVHDWKDGECTLCHTKCTHESWTGNECNTCKIVCTHEHWTGGVCDTCHYACPHGNWTEGVCDTCHYACPHESWTGNECDTCHYVCQHSEGKTVTTTCNRCGGVVSTTDTASTLSEGNLAIITAVAGLAFGFLAAMLIFKKKKPALASGENKAEE